MSIDIPNSFDEPDDELLPDNYDELIHETNIKRAEGYNPRNEDPSEDLINSIETIGLRQPVIGFWRGNTFFLTDGWQRTQAFRFLGEEWVPAEVCESAFEAGVVGRADSIQKEWTKCELIIHCRKMYEDKRENGNDHQETMAIMDNRMEQGLETLKKYVAIGKLPRDILELIQEDEKRTSENLGSVQDISDINILMSSRQLNLGAAELLAEGLGDVSDYRLRKIATNVFSSPAGVAKETIKRAVEHPRKDIKKIHREVIDKNTEFGEIRVGNVELEVEPEEHQTFRDEKLLEEDVRFSEWLGEVGEREIEKFVDQEENNKFFTEPKMDQEVAQKFIDHADGEGFQYDELASIIIEKCVKNDVLPENENTVSDSKEQWEEVPDETDFENDWDSAKDN